MVSIYFSLHSKIVIMELGLRVVRGPNWNWNDADDGEGHVGTVSKIGSFNRCSEETVTVTWDSGHRCIYKVGCEIPCALRIVDNTPAGVTHPNVRCHSCKMQDIAGMRWKCGQCENFDLCSECYMSDKHDLTHPFVRFETVNVRGVEVPIRKGAVKITKKGIFASAKVTRGPDWRFGNEDGGRGAVGIVLRIEKCAGKERAGTCVLWPSGCEILYHVGYEGKVDLKYIEEALGGWYYRDHLPILGNEIIIEETEEDKFNKNRKSWALLIQNLENLLLSNQFCDFTIKVADREFKVHKTILGAQSSVFASMLQHDMKEKNTGIVEIFDCDPATFEDFLHYLYSGKTERISHENVTTLCELAEKYDVQGLKEACVHLMKTNLSVDIICDVMALAVRHGDNELIKMGTEYFVSNAKEILPTVKWQIFMKENPVPANELYIKAYNIAINKN